MAVSFDTPSTSTSRAIQVTGTIPAYSDEGFVTVILNVTGGTRNDTFYQEITLPANTTGTAVAQHATYNLAIVPKLRVGIHTVAATWSFSFL